MSYGHSGSRSKAWSMVLARHVEQRTCPHASVAGRCRSCMHRTQSMSSRTNSRVAAGTTSYLSGEMQSTKMIVKYHCANNGTSTTTNHHHRLSSYTCYKLLLRKHCHCYFHNLNTPLPLLCWPLKSFRWHNIPFRKGGHRPWRHPRHRQITQRSLHQLHVLCISRNFTQV